MLTEQEQQGYAIAELYSRFTTFLAINMAETIDQVYEVMRIIANEDGLIAGRHRNFNVEKMIANIGKYMTGEITTPNIATREFGIRQQMMYIKYCEDRDKASTKAL